MKHSFILLSLAALTLAGCSSDEQTSGPAALQNKGIAFRPTLAGATRGTEADLDVLKASDGIGVTAVASDAAKNTNSGFYFSNVAFKWDANTSFFNSKATGTEYDYPDDGTWTVDFYAWYPKADAPTITNNNNSVSAVYTNFTPSTTMADQKDLMIAIKKQAGASDKSTGTPLNFQHALSQIEVKAKNTGTVYYYEVYGVKIGSVFAKGTFTYPNANATAGTNFWTNLTNPWSMPADRITTGNTTSYKCDSYTTGININSSTGARIMPATGGNFMLVPQQNVAWTANPTGTDHNTAKNSYIAVAVKIYKQANNNTKGDQITDLNGMDNDGLVWAAVGIDTKWEPGKKYTYTLDFTHGAGNVEPDDPDDPDKPILNDKIRFTVSVSDWVAGTTTTGNMQQ